MRTVRIGRDVDWRPTVGAVENLNVLSQFFDFLRRERTYEVLFSQEIEKSNESSMAIVASPIGESRVALHVMSQQQS
jgi:hypothetical protein